ncbi:hypothetical protein NQZ68_023040 [Dissostichus eleginoides]|nr:hypothetical protein NQZ68_023040 [Dissostichus eleginoides]
MSGQRLQGCRSLHLNEDNGRFVLLAVLIVLYLLCGAAVFSAIERPSELRAHGRWHGTLLNFSETFNISLQELNSFLREYEAAIATGIRADALRPRWDFTGAFYFVGTVVSTIVMCYILAVRDFGNGGDILLACQEQHTHPWL